MSSAHVVALPGRVEVAVQLDDSDVARLVGGTVDRNADGRIDSEEIAAGAEQLCHWLNSGFSLVLTDEILRPDAAEVSESADGDVVWKFAFGLAGKFEESVGAKLRVDWLDRLPRGHRCYTLVVDDQQILLAEALLHRRSDSIGFSARGPRPTVSERLVEFAILGVEHIWIGYDHILFLLALLVGVRSLRSAVGLISAFTLAHSVTLALASFDWLRIPGGLVESVIALSIVYVAIENLVVKCPRHRLMVTFGFGLVHGFGFASVLRDLGLGQDAVGVAVPLVAFNLGVELGQLAIALVVVPVLLLLARRPDRMSVVAKGGSVAAAIAGAWWLLERTVLGG